MNPIEQSEFDEDWYLDTYEDVRGAVYAGGFKDGYEHFTQFGFREGRDGRLRSSGRIISIYSSALSDDPLEQTKSAWSISADEQAALFGWYWMAHPMVRARTNAMQSGEPDMDGYGRLSEIAQERGLQVPFARTLSLGCGFGVLERDLSDRGLIDECDAIDIADAAIEQASRLAQEGGYERLRYRVADLDREMLPERHYDLIFAHQSVHHVERLEELFEKVASALKPNGLLHLNEFVGPTRFQWTDDQLRLVNEFLDTLPEELRQTPRGRKAPVVRPTVEAMIRADPSESVRSSEILDVLQQRFRIIEKRPYGGSLLHIGLGEIAQNFRENDPNHRAHLERFFALEDEMMDRGHIGSDYVVVVAEVRR